MTLWLVIGLVAVLVVIVVCRLLAQVIREVNRYDRGFAPQRRHRK